VLALLLALLASEPFHDDVRYALIALLALSMGVQNASAQRLGVPELTTTVLTRTLTGLATETTLVKGPGAKLGRRTVAVAAMLLGALVGGLLALRVSVASDLAVAVAIVLSVAIGVHLASRSEGAWTRA
jgi:uncharacterized membrane protein YoaK (UPF0700 family)